MKLTRTEHEILTRLQRGDSTKRIACALVVTNGCVSRHIANIMAKYGVASRYDLPGMTKATLTPWRQQITELYGLGLSGPAIAARLNVDTKTISTEIWEMRREGVEIPYRRKATK